MSIQCANEVGCLKKSLSHPATNPKHHSTTKIDQQEKKTNRNHKHFRWHRISFGISWITTALIRRKQKTIKLLAAFRIPSEDGRRREIVGQKFVIDRNCGDVENIRNEVGSCYSECLAARNRHSSRHRREEAATVNWTDAIGMKVVVGYTVATTTIVPTTTSTPISNTNTQTYR